MKPKSIKANNRKGFSLVEVLVVIGIMAVLGAGMSSYMVTLMRTVRSINQKSELESLSSGILLMLSSKNTCPVTMSGLTVPSPWTNQVIDLNYLQDTPTQKLIQVGTAKDKLLTRSIKVHRLQGPFPVRINTAPTGSPAVLTDMQQYFAKMIIRIDKEILPGESNAGGDAFNEKAFYLSLVKPNASASVFSCYGGQNQDFFQTMCEEMLGGEYNENHLPRCLIRGLGITNSFSERESKLSTPINLNAGPPYLYVQGGVYSQKLHIGDGDFGLWGPGVGTNTTRNWIGLCDTAACQTWGVAPGPASRYLHVSGFTNPNAGLNGTNRNRRVIGLHDSVFIPDSRAQLGVGIGLGSVPNDTHLFVGHHPLLGITRSIVTRGDIVSERDIVSDRDMVIKRDLRTIDGDIHSGANITAVAAINAGTTVTAASDRRLKTDIQDLQNPLQKILNLQPKTYIKKNYQGKEIGFIAQDVQKVIPEVVVEHEGLLHIAYQNLTAVLAGAVKEIFVFINVLKFRVSENERKLSQLNQSLEVEKKRNDELQKRLKALEISLQTLKKSEESGH